MATWLKFQTFTYLVVSGVFESATTSKNRVNFAFVADIRLLESTSKSKEFSPLASALTFMTQWLASKCTSTRLAAIALIIILSCNECDHEIDSLFSCKYTMRAWNRQIPLSARFKVACVKKHHQIWCRLKSPSWYSVVFYSFRYAQFSRSLCFSAQTI